MEKKVYVELPPFTGRNVPITEIAAAMHKDAQYVRVGLQKGILKFGYAIKLDNSLIPSSPEETEDTLKGLISLLEKGTGVPTGTLDYLSFIK